MRNHKASHILVEKTDSGALKPYGSRLRPRSELSTHDRYRIDGPKYIMFGFGRARRKRAQTYQTPKALTMERFPASGIDSGNGSQLASDLSTLQLAVKTHFGSVKCLSVFLKGKASPAAPTNSI